MEKNLIFQLGECHKRNVSVEILLDGFRGNRKGSSSMSLLAQMAPHAKINQFFSPLMKSYLPDRVREIVGTQHIKLIVVDDSVVITGANLSEIYFTNRQDRYCLVRNEGLAEALMTVVQSKGATGVRNVDSRDVSIEFNVMKGFEGEGDAVTSSVLREIESCDDEEGVQVTISTPYLNLTPEITRVFAKTKHKVNVITNSKSTNAFYNSRGLSKHVPEAYSILQTDLMRSICNPQVTFLQYERDNWSFHPKGIWVSRQSGEKVDTTIIGSSNFGYRSLLRDLEISFKLQSDSTSFKNQLRLELARIKKFCSPIDKMRSTFHSPFLAFLVRGPLRSFL